MNYFIWAQKFFIKEGAAGRRPSGLRLLPIQSGVRAGSLPRPRLSTFYLLLSTFFFLFLSSCTTPHDKLPAQIIPPDSMVQILADFYLAEALANEAGFNQDASELRKSFYKYIIRAHSTDYQRLKTSIDYYAARPDQFSDISEKVIEELSRRQAKANE